MVSIPCEGRTPAEPATLRVQRERRAVAPGAGLRPGIAGWLAVIALLFVAAEPAPAKKLDPVSRAKVLMALTGLVLLGCGMVAGVMLGGRMVRRLARARVASRTRERAASGGPWLPADPLAGMADPFEPPEEGDR